MMWKTSHVVVFFHVCPNSSIVYCLGNVAADCVAYM